MLWRKRDSTAQPLFPANVGVAYAHPGVSVRWVPEVEIGKGLSALSDLFPALSLGVFRRVNTHTHNFHVPPRKVHGSPWMM